MKFFVFMSLISLSLHAASQPHITSLRPPLLAVALEVEDLTAAAFDLPSELPQRSATARGTVGWNPKLTSLDFLSQASILSSSSAICRMAATCRPQGKCNPREGLSVDPPAFLEFHSLTLLLLHSNGEQFCS